MANFIGIDLGTTYSAVAVLDETGRPTIVHNQDGQNITPSVVTFLEDGGVEVGDGPRKILGRDLNTVGRFKREMGTGKTYEILDVTYTPADLSMEVLKHLKKDAESTIGPIKEAVVTVPANFANEARTATLEAARRAGLKVSHIINEPTAAALYYAFKAGKDFFGNYAVYDLGGGTFDISIIKINGHKIEVLATNGVSRLGGADFDQALQKLVGDSYRQSTGEELLEADFTSTNAEDEKKLLSKRDHSMARGPGENIKIFRKDFEEAISGLIAQAEMLCETTLDEAGLSASDIQEVFLVGGSTRIPAVKASVDRIFGKESKSTTNVDEAVAMGAALYAAFYASKEDLNPAQARAISGGIEKIVEITSKFFGTLCLDDTSEIVPGKNSRKNSIIIPKGQIIPCTKSESFYTVHEGQTKVECEVTEAGTHETDPRNVNIIWEGELELPPGRPAHQEIRIEYSYTIDQTMECSFVDVATGNKKDIDLSMGKQNTVDPDQIDKFTID